MSATQSRSPGRPRDPRLHDAITDATVALIADGGYDALTMDALACRAGTTKAAIYRRWPSKAALVAGVFADRQAQVNVPDTGSLQDDLVAHTRVVVDTLSGEQVGRAVLNLVVASRSHPELGELLRQGFVRARRHIVIRIIEQAARRGELRPGADPELAADLLLGPVYYRLLVSGDPVDPPWALALVEAVVAVLSPA